MFSDSDCNTPVDYQIGVTINGRSTRYVSAIGEHKLFLHTDREKLRTTDIPWIRFLFSRQIGKGIV